MTEEIHATPSTTPNIQTELAAQLAELMPEVIADGKVDVEKLMELLDGDVADTSERFGLFWPGKKRALRAAQEPTTATLRPDFENSKDWDHTKNVFIEGDNLEVLKILQKHYHAKIKMIYIDPPYNTGKDFVYPDNYKEGLDTYLEWTRQVNEEGKRLSTNADTEGRYHSNWLNMMYPRLKLARNLLTEDGVIFVSIDDTEVSLLRRLLDEVFGEGNFLGQFVWVTKNAARGVPPRTMLMSNHEYVIAYARRAGEVKFKGLERDAGDFGNPDSDPRGLWRSESMKATGAQNNYFTIADPKTGRTFHANWAFSEPSVKRMIEDGLVIFPDNDSGTPRQKKFIGSYLNDRKAFVTNLGWYSTENATKALMSLFGGKKVFDFPKPLDLLTFFVEQATIDDLVLDFFAGSGSLAHATMLQNAKDGGSRRYIQVQLPEPTPDGSAARNSGFRTIADLARERIRRAGSALVKEDASLSDATSNTDVGFRAYKLADTSFSKWKQSSDVELNQLEQHLLDLRESSSADDASADGLLSEILLKQGYSLIEQIAPVDVAGLNLRSVGDGVVLAYLNEHVKPTLEQLRAVVDEDPARLIVLEDAFQGDDQLKTNLAQLCKSKGIELWTA
ncbi:site-specific DNA-methyltransferase [Brevibacterium antiquum]|uniref:Adenine-specific DNA-methyltransferase n=1 Tax=Brevibacterium antiquum TaxID=234835 RepID=A0A2H1KF13_9MICO|nr:site-specific DNA-methyltransferase [Brevibacterium antiquum]SMX98168.1 adenine-specific DNA-methyltransferase [Brevibacterium antiquum]